MMFSPPASSPTPPALQQAATQTIRVIYQVAPLSICRSEAKSNKLARSACLIFDAVGESGVIVVPYPPWFKKHTWTKTVRRGSGKDYKAVTENRSFWDYIESVILINVRKLLESKDLAPFKLEIAP